MYKLKAIQFFSYLYNLNNALLFALLNLAWNLEISIENKAHLLVLCKFSGSIPEVSDSASNIELSSK
jgi:hypothetical protein